MIKTFWTILFLLTINVCAGQSYLPYYKLVSEAETDIVNSEFKTATVKYLKAFELVDLPYAKDLKNAALSSSKAGMDTTALYLIEKLLYKGVDIKKIKSKVHRHLYRTPEWKRLKKGSKQIVTAVL